MLNMNRYIKTELFQFGAQVELISGALNRYHNGAIRGKLTVGTISSSGTGHWPFTLFDLSFLTGAQAAWQLTICGIVVGSRKVHDLDENGLIQGPDMNGYYAFISCFNHKNLTMEEITNAD